MSTKIKDINVKSHTYYFFNDIIDIKNFDTWKVVQRYSYLLHWICDDQIFEICKN